MINCSKHNLKVKKVVANIQYINKVRDNLGVKHVIAVISQNVSKKFAHNY